EPEDGERELRTATGIIDGLDGKQARVKMMMSKIGKFEEVSDRIYEYSWYLAMAYYFSYHGYGTVPYILFAIMFILHFADISISAVFKYRKGVQLDDFGQLERNFRWIGSRRNTNIWTLIPFFIAGAFYKGFVFIAGYYGITVFFKVWRLIVHFSKNGGREKIITTVNKHEQPHKD
ncbi:MAG TPA: hypothetical protein PLZ43_15795, partial [bacterium]|nr:hypothetical protein [bacterium]